MQDAGFEVRHVESLREHYALTLRAWVAQPRGELGRRGRRGGRGRARVWRLYMAAAALGFEHDDNQIHQVLATAPTDGAAACRCAPIHLTARRD